MASKPLTDAELMAAIEAVRAAGGVAAHAARNLGIPGQTLASRLKMAQARGFDLGAVNRAASYVAPPKGEIVAPAPAPQAAAPLEIPSESAQLRSRVMELERQVRDFRGSAPTDEYVKHKIIGLAESVASAKAPAWLVKPVRGDATPGVPVALWSDWHAGEVVFPTQIGGVNEFNLEILERRVRKLVDKTVYLLRHHVVNPQFPGIVVNLGGDMLSGDIHDELRETNEQPTMVVMVQLFGLLRWALLTLADEFGQLFVPCVSGNHGRNTRKPRAKGRNFTNFDWLLYQFLAQSFEHDERIKFYIPDGPDALYAVYGHRYLLTHGDQFRGGDGMIGHFGPVLRGHKKKLSRNANIGQEFDTLLHGHFHTYFPTQKILGNGSLKGYDEYAASENFGYEPPIQALWLTHPEHGITMHIPVYLEAHAGHQASKEWVRWRDAA